MDCKQLVQLDISMAEIRSATAQLVRIPGDALNLDFVDGLGMYIG